MANAADYVAVVAVDESVATDEGNHAADSVANAADFVAVVQITETGVVDSTRHAGASAVQRDKLRGAVA